LNAASTEVGNDGDRARALGVLDRAAVLELLRHEQHARAHAFEMDEAHAAQLSAIERGVDRARALGDPDAVEQVGAGPRDLEQQLSALGVPVPGHEAVVALQTGGARGERRRRGRRHGGGGGQGQCDHQGGRYSHGRAL